MGIILVKMKLLKAFTLSSMVAAGTVLRETEASASGIAEPKERERRFLGMLAAAAAHHFLGDDVADETASPADFSMEQSENMPEERQRRFWGALAHAAGSVARGLLGEKSENWHSAYNALSVERQKRFWGQLAHAAGSFAKGFMGDSSPNAADLHNEYAAMPEHRQRRFWRELAPRLVALPEAFLVMKLNHQLKT